MSTSEITLALSTPEDLIAAVPNLFGYHPQDSVVVITVTTEHLIGTCLRIPVGTDLDSTTDTVSTALDADTVAALVIVVAPGPAADHEPAYQAVCTMLDGHGVTVAVGLWTPATTGGQPWCSYDDPGECGITADPSATVLATEFAMMGRRVHGSVQEMAALLTPDPDDLLRDRAHQVEVLTAAGHTGEANDLVRLVEQTIADPTAPTTADLPCVALALAAADASATCATLIVDGHSRTVEHVMTLLPPQLPGAFRAHAATFAALAAYDSGDGTFARLCVETALEADPTHRLARLTHMALACGIPPHELRELLRRVPAPTER